MIGRSLVIDLGTQLACRAVDVARGTLDEVDLVRQQLDSGGGCDVVVGVGGGQTLDVAKFAAFGAGLPFIAVPTQASHDGMSSPVSVLDGPGDEGRNSHGARPPAALVVPTHAILQAPKRTLIAGIADLASNVLALADWEWAARFHGDPFDDYAALLARSAAELVVARRDLYTADGSFDEEDIEMLVHGLILSGLAMTLAGSSRPCSGAEHLVSHAFDRLGLGTGLHGEQVAVGSVLAARFYDGSERVLDLLRRIGAPLCPGDLGISRDDALSAVRLVPEVRPGRHSRLSAAVLTDEAYVLEQAEDAWFG
jgi:glycerol-1-phosphate dehydrogenase [NAD(P)+]